MTKKTGYLLGMLCTIIICMILAWIFCCGVGATSTTVTETRETVDDTQNELAAPMAATSMGFILRGVDGDFAYDSNDNFNFSSSSFSIITPVSGQVEEGIGKLKAYFDAEGNSDKMINITGYYDSDERNTSAFPNLGLARSTAIKNYFVNQGIASNRINTYGELRDRMVPDGTVYKGPAEYHLFTQKMEDKEASNAVLDQLAEAIKNDPLVMYFEYSETSVTLSEEQRQKIGDINRYLDKVEGAIITIEGHTDSQGATSTNDRLGLERAEFAKKYLENNGIPGEKIKTVSKGEREPIATNQTDEGRSKNRRAVITIN